MLERLYDEFLDNVAFAHNIPSDVHKYHGYVKIGRADLNAPSPSDFDADHFAVFIEELGKRAGPLRASQVLADMFLYRIPPNDHCVTVFSCVCAFHGDIDALVKFLDTAEAKPSHESEISDHPPDRLPVPNLRTYAEVLKVLRQNNDVKGAARIVDRLVHERGYKTGTYQPLDQILSDMSKHDLVSCAFLR